MAEKKIKGVTYRVNKLPAKRSLVLFAKLGKIVGPGLAALVEAIGLRSEDEAESNAVAVKAISKVFADTDPVQFGDLVEEIVELAEIEQDGRYLPVSMDGHFSGKMEEMTQVVAFVLREQFSDFFTGLLASGKVATKAA